MQSALEREISRRAAGFRLNLAGHDRAVLAGLALSLVPFPPVTCIGLLLTAVNLALLAAGRLHRSELPLLLVSLVAGVLYAILWYRVALILFGLDLPARGITLLRGWLAWFGGLGAFRGPSSPGFRQI